MADRLSSLTRKNKPQSDIQRYSRFIRFMKLLLPLMLVGIIGLLIIWPQISQVETVPLNQDDLRALQSAERENRLLRPVFNTLDNQGRPFSITAESARQSREAQETVFLTAPQAEIHDDTESVYSLEAKTGTYDQNAKILILGDGVLLRDTDDNVLTTDRLITDIPQNRAQSEGPATLTTRMGTIEGQSVIIDHQKQTTVFQGPAKAVINQ